MTIVVEDGSIIAGANSYASVDDFKAYADIRGVTYGVDADIEVLLIKAMDYLEAKAASFIGDKLTRDQPLQWPRANALIQGFYETGIPKELLYGQLALAIEAISADLQPVVEQRKNKVKVDVIEVEYDSKARQTSVFSKAEAHLTALYKNGGLYSINSPITRA